MGFVWNSTLVKTHFPFPMSQDFYLIYRQKKEDVERWRVAIAGEVGWSFFGFSPGLDRGKILTFHLFSVLQLFLINQTEDCF